MTTDATRRKRDGWPARLHELHGRMARLRKSLKSGWCDLPKGMLVEIRSGQAWHKLNIWGEHCGKCGVRTHMSGVSWRDLELLPEDPELHIGDSLPPDVRRLVIAGRVAWQAGQDVDSDALTELDRALEAFADRVPWEH